MHPRNLFRSLAALILFTPFATLSAAAQNIATPQGMQKVFIQDPAFDNMNAIAVFIPVKWHFQGTIIRGTSCKPVPSGVWRASSPDGLTMLEHMPRMDWAWGGGPMAPGSRSDCLPLHNAMAAPQFLKYLVGTMKVNYVSDDPLSADILAMVKKSDDDANAGMTARWQSGGMGAPPVQKTDVARAIVTSQNGSFTLKGLLQVSVLCTTTQFRWNPRAASTPSGNCTADIRYEHAPEPQFQSAVALLDSHKTGAVTLNDWGQAWIAQNERQTAGNIAKIRSVGANNIANIQASGEQARHSMDVQYRTHQEFLASMQRATDVSINRTGENMRARSTATSDWVDYSLDQQTVRDPNTGQISKVSNEHRYTWLDNTGKIAYTTDYAGDNPNGVFKGDWTRQDVTHGDGTDK